jgi:hypothetical protein
MGNRKTPYLMFQLINFAEFTGLTVSINRNEQHQIIRW